MWFSESFWRNLWFFVPRRCLLSCVLYISHTFCIGSYNWFCTLIRSCLISSVWSHLFDLILYFLLRSCHLYALFINSHECFYTVVRALSEKPLWNYRSCGLFWFRSSFFVFLFWCERTSYLLLWILSSCILILYLWIFFCRIASCRLRNSHWGSFTGASQAICQVNVLYQVIRPLSNYRFTTITMNQFW